MFLNNSPLQENIIIFITLKINLNLIQMHADTVELLVAVVKYKTLLKAPRLGLCSNWMASLTPASELSVWVKSGSFMFPDSPVRLIVEKTYFVVSMYISFRKFL